MKLYTTDGNFIKETDDYPTNYTGMIEDQWGNQRWYLNAISHRDNNLPAIILKNGTTEWRVNGRLHRTDGPAMDREDGYKEWFVDGKRHRIDGPACEDSNGIKVWFFDDKKVTEEACKLLCDMLKLKSNKNGEIK